MAWGPCFWHTDVFPFEDETVLDPRSHFQDCLGFSEFGTLKRCKVLGRLVVLGKCGNCKDLVEFCGVKESSNVSKAGCEEFSLLGRLDWNGSALKFLPVGGVTGKLNFT